jgi:hypothetical protein
VRLVNEDTRAEVAAVVERYRWLPLVPVTALVVLLAATGVLPAWPGLVHLVALPPLDLFGDMRALLTTTTGPVSFSVTLVLVLAVRILVLALMTGGLTRRRIVLAGVFYGVLLVPLLLAAQFVYIANTLMYSRLFWGAFVAVVILFLLRRAERSGEGAKSGPVAVPVG